MHIIHEQSASIDGRITHMFTYNTSDVIQQFCQDHIINIIIKKLIDAIVKEGLPKILNDEKYMKTIKKKLYKQMISEFEIKIKNK